jgi:hypothetical protein
MIEAALARSKGQVPGPRGAAAKLGSFLAKPFSPSVLTTKIREVLSSATAL